jgi:hypothetical protein
LDKDGEAEDFVVTVFTLDVEGMVFGGSIKA